MKKLITIVLSIGIVLLCSSDEAYAMKKWKKSGNSHGRNANKSQQSHQRNSKVEAKKPLQDGLPAQDTLVVEELVHSVEKLEIGEVQDSVEMQQGQLHEVFPADGSFADGSNLEQEATLLSIDLIPSALNETVDSEHERLELQASDLIIHDHLSKDREEESSSIEKRSDEQQVQYASELDAKSHIESALQGESLETKLEVAHDEELASSFSDNTEYLEKAQGGQSFQVTFKDNSEKEVFTHCDSYRFCEFMTHALKRMSEPETVSMVRNYGFGLGHVPLLLVWSSHLFDRLHKSDTYCMETQDLKDILMLMLIIDLRAQVDAACIEHMKKSSPSRNALAVQTDSKVIEQATSCTPFTARYLKSKLATLWSGKIQEMYRKKKLPSYSTILQKVKDIAALWQDDQFQSPIWVCCVMHSSFMTFHNMLAGWPSDRFGNWWNPVQPLIIACQGRDYSEIRRPKTEEVLVELEKYTSWSEYFGDMCWLVKADDAEYDSDGGY